jgi:hypothetical protein
MDNSATTTTSSSTLSTADLTTLQEAMESQEEEWETFCYARTVLEQRSLSRTEETSRTTEKVMEYESRMDDWLYPFSSGEYSDPRSCILR